MMDRVEETSQVGSRKWEENQIDVTCSKRDALFDG